MDSDEGKLFIGGVSWETTEEKLVEHFSNYGAAVSAVVMRDKINNRPRGFAFVSFDNPAVLDRVLADQHVIDGRTVEAKRALSRDEQQSSGRSGNFGAGKTLGGGSGGGGGNTRTKKIFVGGLPATLTNEGLSQYFGKFGDVSDVVVMYDANTQRPRGFGFVTFVSDESVDKALAVNNFHELDGKLVEVKRALPKDMNHTNGSGRSTSGTHQAYNASPYEVKVAANSYAQPTGANNYAQPTGGGYPAYGSSGYGAPGGYGYGAANNGLSYGVGGGYGTGPASGYSGVAPTSGYTTGGPAGAQRSPWNNQQSAGFGSGYGGGGMAVQPTGGAAAGYGNQGYGGYAGAGGSYMNQAGYGAGGGRGVGPTNPAGGAGEQGGASAYVDGGFAGAMDSGYQASWRSNPSAGGGYGTGQVSGPPGGPSGYGGYPGQMQ